MKERVAELQTRVTLFIGHANPEDNEFTAWLQSKLINEGYQVECDFSFLLGGEKDFWNDLQNLIRNNVCKYILVLSQHTFTKDGVIDEWEFAKSIEKEFGIKDFIIPLRIDEVAFNTRIGLNKRNIIPFTDWKQGIRQLFRKLKQDNTPHHQTSGLSLSLYQWLRNKYSSGGGIRKKKEKYFSNWLEIPALPDMIYLFRYTNDAQAKAVLEEESLIPVIRHDNYLITFQEQLKELNDNFGLDVKPIETIILPIKNILYGFESDQFPKNDDSKRFLVRILKEAFRIFLLKRRLLNFDLSNNKQCFFYPEGVIEDDKVFFPYGKIRKWRQLIGQMGSSIWHFGISFEVLLFPYLCFSLRSHIVFSDDGKTIWTSKKRLHAARRKKGKRMFNKEWRDYLLAFLYSLISDDGKIHVPLTKSKELILHPSTIEFYSNYGYEDPRDNARIIPLDDYEDDLDEELIEEYFEPSSIEEQ